MKYFFIHIPKTAGTSLRVLLQRNVNPDHVLSVYPGHDTLANWANLNTVLKNPEKYQEKQYFIGHFNFGLHQQLGFDIEECRYITFLRNPVDRVISLYKHFLSYPGGEHDLIVNENLSLPEFLEHPKINQQAMDHMTQIISGSKVDVKLAIDNIEQYFLYVGYTENYNQSLIKLCDILGWNKRPHIHNNASLIKESLLDAEGIIKNKIIELNQSDMELYQYFRSKQLQKTPKTHNQFDNVEIWHDLAAHVVNSNLKLACQLMQHASTLDPTNVVIKNKLQKYKSRLKNKLEQQKNAASRSSS